MMTDIVTLTLNPAVDVSTSVAQVVDTRKLRCGAARHDPGGGGINVARVVRRLGGDCSAVYLAGGRTGRLLGELLDAEQVAGVPLAIAGETRTDFSVTETSTGKQFRFVLPGPTIRQAEWQACLDYFATLTPPRYLVLSGSLPPGVPVDFYATLARSAASRGTQVVVDTSGPALEAVLQGGVSLFKPSLQELRDLTRQPLLTEAAWRSAAQRIVSDGRARMVVLTLGSEGALLVTGQQVLRAPGLPTRVESAIGAGDSFLGAMIWALNRGADEKEAFRYGVAAASAALQSTGTGLCQREDVLRRYEDVVLGA